MQDFNHISSVIEEQINILSFSKTNFTLNSKKAALNSYLNVYRKNPQLIFNSLVGRKRSGGLQNILFKEFVSEIEASLPFLIFKNKKRLLVSDLMSPVLNIFDGISKFSSTINDKLKIKNETKEFYIGGRLGAIAQPYYIGRIISITDDKGIDLISNVEDYTFNFIKMKSLSVGQMVNVIHYRTYPHYQMGAMTYINRARQLLIEQLKLT